MQSSVSLPTPHYVLRPYLMLRTGADRRMVIGAMAGGAAADVAFHNGAATIATAIWVWVIAAALLLGGRVRGLTARLLIAAAAVFALGFATRSSPWVLVPVTTVICVLLLLGASLGADRGRLGATLPVLGTRLALGLGHLAVAPGAFRPRGRTDRPGGASRLVLAVGRGVLLGAPVLLVVGLLLAAADPIFRSWFDLRAIAQHVLLVGIGAWVVAGLARTASAAEPSPALRSPPELGAVEAGVVLGGLSALYAAFAGAQLVALSGAGHRILVTRGLTYAQYARSGFFELLACAAVTLLVLLGVRACTSPGHHVLNALAGLTVAFTLVVVVVAVRRLQLYEAAFGLTMLRLACLAVAVWIGIVFLLVAATIPRRGLPGRQLAAALLASVLLLVGGWAACNPASIVAAVNLHRAETGRPLDVGQAASLGPDATPALVAALPRLSPGDQGALLAAICEQWPGPDAGTAFSLSRSRAEQALDRACDGP